MPGPLDLLCEVAATARELHTARDLDAFLLAVSEALDAGGYTTAATCLRCSDVVSRLREEAEERQMRAHTQALEDAAEQARVLARAEAHDQVGDLLEQAQKLMIEAVRCLDDNSPVEHCVDED